MPPDVLVDADDTHSLEARGVADQHPVPLVQDCGVGGVPGGVQRFGDARDTQMLVHDRAQSPVEGGAGNLGAWLGRRAQVLAPDMLAVLAEVAAQPDDQRGRPHPEGDVGQAAGDGVAWDAFGAAAVAERIVGGRPVFDPGVGLLKVLAGGGQAQGVQAAEGREVRGSGR